MAAGAHGALCDRPDDTDLVPEVHGKSVDVLCPTAGIRLHQRPAQGLGALVGLKADRWFVLRRPSSRPTLSATRAEST